MSSLDFTVLHWTDALVQHPSVKGAELMYASQITYLVLYTIKSKAESVK